MPTRDCQCGKPIPANNPAALCDDCCTQLRTTVEDLPSLVDDVNLTVTRQTATGNRNGSRSSADQVIAWDDRASKSLARVLAAMVSWARSTVPALDREAELLAAVQQPTGEQLARIDRVDQYRTYLTGPRWVITGSHHYLLEILLDQLPHLVARPEGPAFARDADRWTRELLAAADTPAPRLYLGPCLADPLKNGTRCPEEVYAVDHSDQGKGHLCDRCRSTRCPTCGTEHDVRQRRAWLAEALDDRLATAGDIARGLATTTGVGVTTRQINWWVSAGRLTRRGKDQNGTALYRVGDVRDLAIEAQVREQEKATRRADRERGA